MNTTMRGKAEAGRRGDDVRSDLWISIENEDLGGLMLNVKSKVDSYYGASIRESIRSILDAFDVHNARVDVEDKGALPFVIQARVEAALRRAGYSGEALPEPLAEQVESTPKNRLRRSRLYLPGNEPKFMVNAGLHKPDAVILDLEDSVHPDEKDTARLVVRNALRCVDFLGAERMVRINQLPLGLSDLDAIVPENPNLILIPKVESGDQVRGVHERITQIQQSMSGRRGAERADPIWLMPIIESALGIEHAFTIANASETVAALTIGLEDYTADLGVPKTTEGTESLYARMRLLNAARAAGVQAIDSVFGDVGDMDGLRSWAQRSRALGFEGMGCIHPRQIQPIHESFAPSAEEVEKALAIVAAFEDAQAQGLGVVSLGTRMIDPPVVLRAQRLVETARKTKQL